MIAGTWSKTRFQARVSVVLLHVEVIHIFSRKSFASYLQINYILEEEVEDID